MVEGMSELSPAQVAELHMFEREIRAELDSKMQSFWARWKALFEKEKLTIQGELQGCLESLAAEQAALHEKLS